MAANALVFSLAALAAAFQFYGFLLSLLMMNTSAKGSWNKFYITRVRPPDKRVTRLTDPATRLGGSPHVSRKRDQIRMRDHMDRRVTRPKRVTSPAWGPPPSCKQALNVLSFNLVAIFLWPNLAKLLVWKRKVNIAIQRQISTYRGSSIKPTFFQHPQPPGIPAGFEA